MGQPHTYTLSTAQSGPWIAIDRNIAPGNTSLAVVITGTVNATVEYTYDDPNRIVPPNSANPVNVFPFAALAAITATVDSVLNQAVNYVRLTYNSGSGTAAFYVLQAGLAQS